MPKYYPNTTVTNYPFGMLMPGRTYSSEAYIWGFNGQEKDENIIGPSMSIDFKFRIYSSRVCNFLSIDPLTVTYPYFSPYQFAGNSPVLNLDLEGLEPVPGMVKVLNMQKRAMLSVEGAGNVLFGTIGTIGSSLYILETGGVGYALGGAAGMTLSLGEIGIGVSQITSAFRSDQLNSTLHKSSSIPGLIAYGTGSSSAPVVDALGQFLPGMFTGGNITSFADGLGGMYGAFKQRDIIGVVYNGLQTFDAYNDIESLITSEPIQQRGPLKITEPKGPKRGDGSMLARTSNQKSYTNTYKIKSGDTLGGIAESLKTTIENLAKMNNIADVDKINAGDTLIY